MSEAAVVYINDYEIGLRFSMIFSREDFDRLDAYWTRPDKILLDLQYHPVFTGRTRWCDLGQNHFRIMITHALEKVGELTKEQKEDFSNPTNMTLQSMVAGLIRCIETKGECIVEMMHIHRVTPADVVFDYTASLDLIMSFPEASIDKNIFKVVVDNTDEQ